MKGARSRLENSDFGRRNPGSSRSPGRTEVMGGGEEMFEGGGVRMKVKVRTRDKATFQGWEEGYSSHNFAA